MPDVISAAERGLIDAALAAGRVTRVPRVGTGEASADAGRAPLAPLRWGMSSGSRIRPSVAARRLKVLELAGLGLTAIEIAEQVGASPATVYTDLGELRSEGRIGKRPPGRKPAPAVPAAAHADKARAKSEARAAAGVSRVRDRRRFKTTPVPTGEANRIAPAGQAGTVFPSTVKDPGAEPVLKDGASNAKIGGDVLVGWLKGAHIATLTLEERATCPNSCALWDRCYGNSMQWPTRWRHGPELEAAIARDVAVLCTAHERVLVRLHVLGDFYSVGYVAFWGRLLVRHPGLNVFGFTAWPPESEIGNRLEQLRGVYGRRFSIRHSGRCAPWGSFTIDFPTERKTLGDAIVCPEQVSAMAGDGSGRHCGSCGVCWSSDRPIVFVEH